MPRLLRPVTPAGSQPPCGAGARWPPIHPLQGGIRFLLRPLPAPPSPLLARGRLWGLTPCTAPESEAGLPRFASFTNKSGEDASVHREGQRVRQCAVKTHRPALHAVLALGPNGGSSPARVTMRNTEASVALSVPTISRRSHHVPLTVLRFTACLIPRRCQRRTHGSGTGGTTPG